MAETPTRIGRRLRGETAAVQNRQGDSDTYRQHPAAIYAPRLISGGTHDHGPGFGAAARVAATQPVFQGTVGQARGRAVSGDAATDGGPHDLSPLQSRDSGVAAHGRTDTRLADRSPNDLAPDANGRDGCDCPPCVVACVHASGYTRLALHDNWLCPKYHRGRNLPLSNDIDASMAAFRDAERRLLAGELDGAL